MAPREIFGAYRLCAVMIEARQVPYSAEVSLPPAADSQPKPLPGVGLLQTGHEQTWNACYHGVI